MDVDFESNAKFGDIFQTLRGVDMEVEEMDLGVRSYNALKRAGIHNMQQLLDVSLDDLMNLGGKRNYGDIIHKLQFYAQTKI